MSGIGSPLNGGRLAAVIVARFEQPPVAGPIEQLKVMSPACNSAQWLATNQVESGVHHRHTRQ